MRTLRRPRRRASPRSQQARSRAPACRRATSQRGYRGSNKRQPSISQRALSTKRTEPTSYSDWRFKRKKVAELLSIGALAKRAATKVQTIRFYESEALMPEPARSEGGQRRYTK